MTASPLRGASGTVRAATVGTVEELGPALSAMGLEAPRPVVVVVGGAGGLSAQQMRQLRPVFEAAVVPALERWNGVGVDGGTRAGVMRLLGRARTAARASFPLLGVLAEGTVRPPGDAPSAGAAEVDPDHTHLLLVPGDEWGAESPWIARSATVLAGAAGSVTVLANGGDIAWSDVRRSLEQGRPVLTLDGSGRTADELAAASRGAPAGEAASALVGTGMVTAVPVADLEQLGALLDLHLGATGRQDP